MNQFAELASTIQTYAAEREAAIKDANEQFAKLEESLKGFNRSHSYMADGVTICYSRLGNGWSLNLGPSDSTVIGKDAPWKSCNADLRIKAAKLIPAFVDTVKRVIEDARVR